MLVEETTILPTLYLEIKDQRKTKTKSRPGEETPG
jgi:hypothetical protein